VKKFYMVRRQAGLERWPRFIRCQTGSDCRSLFSVRTPAART